MKNLKEIKTTILGLVFLVAGGIYWYNAGDSVNWIALACIGSASVLLFLAPDKLIYIIDSKAKK